MLMVVYHSKMLNVNFRRAMFQNFLPFLPVNPFLTAPFLPLTQAPFLTGGLGLLGGNQQWMLDGGSAAPIIRTVLEMPCQ